ncbi:MAG: Cytidylate kinase [Firmicutes bacterium ADurb.Bin193]|nr:MAG: Cytidylate kinase [Firmicutes bacterium ADurb.Bin193]
MANIRVAIDGPAGAGKSTISKIVAKELGFIYIDTGAMYRAVGLKAIRLGVDTKKDIPAITKLMDDIRIDIKYGEQGQIVILDGEDVTSKIRDPLVSIAASDVSAIPAVRLKLVELQRSLAKKDNVIMDGRDIGSYVLPDAEIKIFLTASVSDRAKRRYDELVLKGIDINLDDVKADIEYRDKNDSSRSFAPLTVAPDALVVDTTGNTLEQSVDLLIGIIKERLDCFSM